MNSIPGVTFRPIHAWPGAMTPPDRRSAGWQFKAGWSSTIELLGRELRALNARDIVLQLDLTERDLRLDGLPRANARPGHPGVILALEAPKVGPLQFACDTYRWWETNVRAIALTLQALRAVERYGAVKTGEQYRGWAALPPPPSNPGNGRMTVEEAARFITKHAGHPLHWDDILRGGHDSYYRDAARRLHPDAGGDVALFQQLQEAKRVLDANNANARSTP